MLLVMYLGNVYLTQSHKGFFLFPEALYLGLWHTLCVNFFMISDVGTSLVVQFLRIHASTAGSMGLNPGQGTKIPDALKCSQGGEKDVDWSTNFKYGYLIFFSTICWRQSFLHWVAFASSSKRSCPCTCGSISEFPFSSTHLFIYLDTNTTLPWLL